MKQEYDIEKIREQVRKHTERGKISAASEGHENVTYLGGIIELKKRAANKDRVAQLILALVKGASL